MTTEQRSSRYSEAIKRLIDAHRGPVLTEEEHAAGHGQPAAQFLAGLRAALKAVEAVSERPLLPLLIRGQWTPQRCLHLGEAREIEALCRFLNEQQGERNSAE